jgi:hypothetical protein
MMNARKLLPLLLLTLFAVPSQATMNISLGTPFTVNGHTYVPVIGTDIPSDLTWAGNISLAVTGSIAPDSGLWTNTFSDVWPNGGGASLPLPFTSFANDDIGFGCCQWYVNVGYSNSAECGVAEDSGLMGAFAVTGCGSIAITNTFRMATDCHDDPVTFTVNTTPVYFGCAGGGGGVGEEAMSSSTEATPAAKSAARRTTWATIKSFYR